MRVVETRRHRPGGFAFSVTVDNRPRVSTLPCTLHDCVQFYRVSTLPCTLHDCVQFYRVSTLPCTLHDCVQFYRDSFLKVSEAWFGEIVLTLAQIISDAALRLSAFSPCIFC